MTNLLMLDLPIEVHVEHNKRQTKSTHYLEKEPTRNTVYHKSLLEHHLLIITPWVWPPPPTKNVCFVHSPSALLKLFLITAGPSGEVGTQTNCLTVSHPLLSDLSQVQSQTSTL